MDIACRYWPYLQRTAEKLPELMPLTEMKPFLSVMHAKAHTSKCEIRWGGRNQEGAGNTVGEEVEQVNSFLSRAALTTKYMTKSGRVDMITILAIAWNARKMDTLHKALAKRFVKTTRRAEMEVANLENLRQEHNISVEDADQWMLDVEQWAISEDHVTDKGSLQKEIEELMYSIKQRKHDLYRQNDSNQVRQRQRRKLDDFVLPWEIQGDVVSFRLKRQHFDQVMLVNRYKEEKIILVKEMIQHCHYMSAALDKLDTLYHQSDDENNELTREGCQGLRCCLLHKQHLLQQDCKQQKIPMLVFTLIRLSS
ncbi:hypothetical protein WMY93_031008 [Mugilogobius chulae]|uniref:Uncharacterized protein n=1 Tax=Mugilogobius chulae TaxID=88201 RepID=A0AAW0MEB1_9GOBI